MRPASSTSSPPPVPPSRRPNIPDTESHTLSNEVDNQSLSAPSSPTHAPKPPPRTNFLQTDTASPAVKKNTRPASMAFNSPSHPVSSPPPTSTSNSKTTYADLRFTMDRNSGPVPAPRRIPEYSQVRKFLSQVGDPDRSGSSTEKGKPGEMAQTYDIPRPPIPLHTDNRLHTDLPLVPPHEADHLAPLPPPPQVSEGLGLSYLNEDLGDINFELNFGPEGAFPSWDNDPYSFEPRGNSSSDGGYLKEVKNTELYSNSAVGELGSFPDFGDNPDITGSSAYEDSSIIQAAINRGKQTSTQDMIMRSNPGYTSPVFDMRDNEHTSATGTFDNEITNVDGSPNGSPNFDSYQFPSELDIHPGKYSPNVDQRPSDRKHNNNNTTPRRNSVDEASSTATNLGVYDEPPMQLLTFPPMARNRDPSSSPPPSRRNLIPSDPPSNRPPLDRSHSTEPVPRPRTNTTPTHSARPPLPPPNPIRRTEHPLPPRNPPARANGQTQEPPLPPRNTTRASASPGPSGPVIHTPPTQRVHQREQNILELVKLGYSRSEVVKALAVAQNSVELAKNILESFGSRKD